MIIDSKKILSPLVKLLPYAAVAFALYLGWSFLQLTNQYDRAVIQVAVHQAESMDTLAQGLGGKPATKN